MPAKAGDRIVVDSEKVGGHRREGEILAVEEAETGVRYTVRWDDGHETTFWPHAGSVRVVPKGERQPA